jgi:predicted MFS family arabinose efflux permease
MRGEAHKGYLLFVLLLLLVFNRIDSPALGLLLQDIKVDLALSDTQLGLLTGIAFTLFYTIMGLPIARWADRGNRILIVSIATALQCGAVAACGLAGNFTQMLAARVAVAVGEAGCVPPANSLIADYFDRAERARATARYMLGYPIAAVVGYLLSGWMGEVMGWRMTFVLLGLPGVALAALAWFTLKDPRLSHSATEAALAAATHPPAFEVARRLWGNRSFRHLVIGFALLNFFAVGVWLWAPTLFIRSYGLTTTEVGAWFALIWGVGGLLGTYWGGELATRHAANDEALQLKVMALGYVGFGIISTGIYLAPNHYVAFGVLALTAVANFATTGPLFGTIQTLVPEDMRASAVAVVYMFANLIGVGLGPLFAGALSDALRASYGNDSLRYALLAMCPGYFWAAWHLVMASRTVRDDIESSMRR